MRFVDTNILLYAISTADDEAAKAAVARELLDATDLALSVQILQEFYVQATRPTKSDRITHEEAEQLIHAWLRFPVQPITTEIVVSAMACARRFQVSYWDGAVIEAARVLGCREVLSEDLSPARDYGGIRVRNPFVPPRRRSRTR